MRIFNVFCVVLCGVTTAWPALAAGGPPKGPNEPPTAALELPANNASFGARANIALQATAADSDGKVQKVYFYANGKLVHYMAKAPYAAVWRDVRPGTYEIVVVAEDNRGARSAPSAPRLITVGVIPPTARMKRPSPVADHYMSPGEPILLQALASDADGSIRRVEFFSGDMLLGSDATSPYQFKWRNAQPGVHDVHAVAWDSSGASGKSAPLQLVVVGAATPTKVAFTPSTVHATHVVRYSLEIFTVGTNPEAAMPLATLDLGKPAVVADECRVDVAEFLTGLPGGVYVATVMTHGRDGQIRSVPSPPFRRQ